MILGTLWLLIHKYEIAEISEEALTSKDGLLLWCMNRTAGYKNVKVENYHRRYHHLPTLFLIMYSWKDGLAFCALIHKVHNVFQLTLNSIVLTSFALMSSNLKIKRTTCVLLSISLTKS